MPDAQNYYTHKSWTPWAQELGTFLSVQQQYGQQMLTNHKTMWYNKNEKILAASDFFTRDNAAIKSWLVSDGKHFLWLYFV